MHLTLCIYIYVYMYVPYMYIYYLVIIDHLTAPMYIYMCTFQIQVATTAAYQTNTKHEI